MAAFIAEIWSARIEAELRKNLVALEMTNSNWEGDIKKAGDTVRIMGMGDITIFDYVRDVDMPVPQSPTDSEQSLLIDQAKGFNFAIDDIDKAQSNLNRLSIYTDKAMYKIRDAIDQFIMAKYTDAGNTDTIASLTVSNVYSSFNDMALAFDDDNVPEENRFATITPRVLAIIRAYLASKGTPLGDEVTKNGYAGKFAGFKLLKSNNLVKTTVTTSNDTDNCMFGDNQAITLAFQIPTSGKNMLKLYEPERRFAQDAIKGLTLYGGKTITANRLGSIAYTFV